MQGRIPIAIFLCLTAAGRAAAADVTQEQIARGHAEALNLCGACHLVAADQRDLPVLKSFPPFFFEIANDPKTTPDSIGKFLDRTHWDFKTRPATMPSPGLSEQQKQDIIAYIMSLRR